MATCEGAAALGLGAVTGSLEPGKEADIVLVETDSPNMFPVYDLTRRWCTARGLPMCGTCLWPENVWSGTNVWPMLISGASEGSYPGKWSARRFAI